MGEIIQRLVVHGDDDGADALLPMHVQLVNEDGTSYAPSGGGGGASITSAQATTLDAGSDATAEIDGTVLRLGIPKGEKGDTGETGPQGATGPAGAAGAAGTAATIQIGTVSTLGAGEQATVTNSGTTSAAILDFGIPQGAAGATGASGAAGAAGAAGADGADGVGVASITLTVVDGAVTSGKWTDTGGGSHDIEIESGD